MEIALSETSMPHYSGLDQLPKNGAWRRGKGANILRNRNPYGSVNSRSSAF
jgi:hypothetical protein